MTMKNGAGAHGTRGHAPLSFLLIQMRSANDVERHGGRLVCPINVREVKNLEMNHDSPPV
jgi:hypothetical protein